VDGDHVEVGWLLIPTLLESVFRGDTDQVAKVASEIVGIAQRFADRDLLALGLMEHGQALVRGGRVEAGLQLVDETMVAVTTGELSPIVAGIIYCKTLSFCLHVFEVRRAREWTDALTRWCEDQPEMVAHNGPCLVHRAELMALGGAWPDALNELTRVEQRFTEGVLNRLVQGDAAYLRGELHRLNGEFADAEAAYETASEMGRHPQPGFALLRLAQGQLDAAAAAIRSAVAETTRWPGRARLLPACAEIMLAVGDADAAAIASRELGEIASSQGSASLAAQAANAVGSVHLAKGNHEAALGELRRAWEGWQALDAPYEAARVRVRLAACCRALGDHDTAGLELAAARRTFEQLGAPAELAATNSLMATPGIVEVYGLTSRELEVLALVAKGNSNREVAAELVLSEHTIARHLQNVFIKLGVSSRTAASAFAHEHGLLDRGSN
jgi:DNA-binding CsgD family transcriptional regulator